MSVELLASAGDFSWALIATAFGFGLRHGIDWDHIGAITDLTSGGGDRRRPMILATVYATGHAVVVVVLGSVAVLAGDYVPETVDSIMGRVVGITLLMLGGYVIYGLVRHGRRFRMQSRWMLLGSVIRRRRARRLIVIEHDHEHTHASAAGHGHTHPTAEGVGHQPEAVVATVTRHHHVHAHIGSLPDDPTALGWKAAFGIGALHGVGAETPTQVVLFVTAGSVAGPITGEIVLLAFTFGLLASNSAIALVATTGFLRADRRFWFRAALATVAGAFSIALGLTYVFGLDILPPLLA